jgi:hypothetical protein
MRPWRSCFLLGKRQGWRKLKLSFSGEILLFCAQPHFKEAEFRASYRHGKLHVASRTR